MKRIIALILAMLVCIGAGIGIGILIPDADNGDSRFEGPGYDTAEAAAMAYIRALKTGDPQNVISTFAVESYVDNFDLEGFVSYLGFYDENPANIRLPDDNAFADGLNYISRYSGIGNQVYNAYRTLIGRPYDKPNIAFSRRDEDREQQISDFVTSLSGGDIMTQLASLEFNELLGPEEMAALMPDCAESISYALESVAENTPSYLRYEDMRCFAARCIFDGREVYIFVDVVKIDGRWYNLSPFSILGIQCGASTTSGGISFVE